MKIPFKSPSKDFYRETSENKFIFDYLPSDHQVFVYAELFKELETSKIEAKYSIKGQNGFHPQMLMGLLIYSYSHGVFSSREIASRCRTDIAFMYISWMLFPDHRSISDFRKNNIETFKFFFKESVLLAKQSGMVNLGHVSLDGSKFKADTSKHKAMSYAHMQKREQELMNEIEELLEKASHVDQAEDSYMGEENGEEIAEELQFRESRFKKIQEAKIALEAREALENPGKEIDGKKQISFADTDARIMGKKGNFQYAYNGQISVESSHQIIVGEHLSEAANDKKEVKPALVEIKENSGEYPDKMSLDNGYFSADSIEALDDKQIDGYISVGRQAKTKEEIENGQHAISKGDFIYNDTADEYTCPEGKTLKLKTVGKEGVKTYQAQSEDCFQCPLQEKCTNSKQGRTIKVDLKEPIRRQMTEKMQSPEAKDIYAKRKTIVEPVFGVIKSVMGFDNFSLRGKQKVSGEFSLVCGAYNIKKIVIAIQKGEVCPPPEKSEVWGVNLIVIWRLLLLFWSEFVFRPIKNVIQALWGRLEVYLHQSREGQNTFYVHSRTAS